MKSKRKILLECTPQPDEAGMLKCRRIRRGSDQDQRHVEDEQILDSEIDHETRSTEKSSSPRKEDHPQCEVRESEEPGEKQEEIRSIPDEMDMNRASEQEDD